MCDEQDIVRLCVVKKIRTFYSPNLAPFWDNQWAKQLRPIEVYEFQWGRCDDLQLTESAKEAKKIFEVKLALYPKGGAPVCVWH